MLDVYTRESLAIEVGQSLKGEDVVTALNQIRQKRGTPKLLSCDNGAEFINQRMDLWAYHNVKSYSLVCGLRGAGQNHPPPKAMSKIADFLSEGRSTAYWFTESKTCESF